MGCGPMRKLTPLLECIETYLVSWRDLRSPLPHTTHPSGLLDAIDGPSND